MLLKTYLIISLITFITLFLANISIMNRAVNKYGDQIEQASKRVAKKDRAGTLLAWLKILIVSFIPVLNIIFLLIIVLATDSIFKKSDEYVEQALKENGIKREE